MSRHDELDLDDPETYDLVRRVKKNNKNVKQEEPNQSESDQKNNESTNFIIDNTPEKNKDKSLDFIKKLILVCICIFLVYLFIYRYVIGYDFLKTKQYVKSMAVMSPELLTLSSFLL